MATNWRHSARAVKLGPVSGMIVFPLLFAAISPSWWKTWTLLGIVAFLAMIELFFKVNIVVALRAVRSALAGKRRAAVPWWKVNRV